MRVVNIMLGAGAGGLEAVGFQYARLLSEAGHDSWMICHARSPYLRTSGEQVIALPNASVGNPLAHFRLADALRRLRPDVVFCHGHRAAQFYTPFLRFLLSRTRPSSRAPFFIAVCHGANGWRCRKFPRTIAVSDGVRDELVNKWHLDPSRVVTIPNAVALPPCASPVRRGEPFVFGFLGRLDRCKGVDILLRAFAPLIESVSSETFAPRLVIGGTGPEEASLRALAEDLETDARIDWLGWVSDKEDFFAKIDVLVMPSREEALGLSLLEAMAHQKPVIVSDCPGPAALVSPAAEPACGLVVPCADVAGLTNALRRLVGDSSACAMFAKVGRERVESRYSEVALQQSIVAELRNCCAKML